MLDCILGQHKSPCNSRTLGLLGDEGRRLRRAVMAVSSETDRSLQVATQGISSTLSPWRVLAGLGQVLGNLKKPGGQARLAQARPRGRPRLCWRPRCNPGCRRPHGGHRPRGAGSGLGRRGPRWGRRPGSGVRRALMRRQSLICRSMPRHTRLSPRPAPFVRPRPLLAPDGRGNANFGHPPPPPAFNCASADGPRVCRPCE